MSPVLVGVALYVVAQFAVGVLVSRNVRSEDDYFVAGRRLGFGLSTFSIFATWFGAETCVGAAGAIHAEGLTRTSVEPFAYGLCLLVMGVVFAAPLWRAKIVTLADFFRTRYAPGVERLAALLLIPTSVFWAAAQVHAFGQVLASATELEAELAVGVAALVVIGYTAAGGMMSDVVTDLVQAIALTIGLLVLVIVVVGELGGVGASLDALAAAPIRIAEPGAPDLLATIEAWALPIGGSVVAQEAIARAVSSRSERIARSSVLAGGALYVAIGAMPVFLALVGARFATPGAPPEHFLPDLAQSKLDTIGYVVFAGAIISAILSTVDSTLLVASSLFSRNLLLAGRAELSQKRRVLTARLCVVGFGIAAWLLARGSESVMEHIEDASGFGSAGILVCVSFGLFTRFGGPWSAAASLAGGVTTWIVGHYVLHDAEHPYLWSLATALGAFLVVGVFERRRSVPIA